MAERRGHGRPNHTDQIGLKKENAIDRAKSRDSVYELSRNMR